MANALGGYNPTFFANEALIQLEEAMGMATRVHRGYEQERVGELGSVIDIKRPSVFSAEDAPSSAQDIATGTVQITMDQWKEVKFKLTDKELAYTGDRIINDHIRPAAVALANNIDIALAALHQDVPNFDDLNASPGSVVTDVTNPRKTMFNNKVPMTPGMLSYMVDGTLEAGLLGNSAFGQWQGAGDEGVRQQITGAMGRRFGFDFFANQNVQSHTKGTVVAGTGALTNGTAVLGATSVAIDDATSLVGTLTKGDVVSFAGDSQKYAITVLATAAGDAMTLAISPPLKAALGDGVAVTFFLDDHVANLAFHRNAFALAMIKLPDLSQYTNSLGAQVFSVQDPITGLSLRARIYYVGDSSEVHVALDVLYGVITLDPNLATRARG